MLTPILKGFQPPFQVDFAAATLALIAPACHNASALTNRPPQPPLPQQQLAVPPPRNNWPLSQSPPPSPPSLPHLPQHHTDKPQQARATRSVDYLSPAALGVCDGAKTLHETLQYQQQRALEYYLPPHHLIFETKLPCLSRLPNPASDKMKLSQLDALHSVSLCNSAAMSLFAASCCDIVNGIFTFSNSHMKQSIDSIYSVGHWVLAFPAQICPE